MASLPPLPEGPSLEQIRVPPAAPNADEFTWVAFAVFALTILLLFDAVDGLWQDCAGALLLEKQNSIHYSKRMQNSRLCTYKTDSVCFADGLIRCLRRYLKNEYSIGLDSYSQTELRSAILKQLDLENQVEVDLAALFEQCEQVKFSQLSLDSHSRDTLQKQAKTLLRQLEPSTQDPKNERFSIRSSVFLLLLYSFHYWLGIWLKPSSQSAVS